MVKGIKGSLVPALGETFSGARGSVGDLVEPPAEDTDLIVDGVSCGISRV